MNTQKPAPWYVEFFGRDYLVAYGPMLTGERTRLETQFVERALGLARGQRVLDLCCGHARHALLLAQRGYRVSGLDLSREYLEMARESVVEESLDDAAFVLGDMRSIPFRPVFDAVINLFSAFGYLESEDEDAKVLHAVRQVLKPGGRVLLDLINREWVVANNIEREWWEEEDGTVYLEHRDLDLLTSRNHVSFTIIHEAGSRHESVGHHIRLYTLTEIAKMLAEAGLQFETVYGDFQGTPYGPGTRRMIVKGRKPMDRERKGGGSRPLIRLSATPVDDEARDIGVEVDRMLASHSPMAGEDSDPSRAKVRDEDH